MAPRRDRSFSFVHQFNCIIFCWCFLLLFSKLGFMRLAASEGPTGVSAVFLKVVYILFCVFVSFLLSMFVLSLHLYVFLFLNDMFVYFCDACFSQRCVCVFSDYLNVLSCFDWPPRSDRPVFLLFFSMLFSLSFYFFFSFSVIIFFNISLIILWFWIFQTMAASERPTGVFS